MSVRTSVLDWITIFNNFKSRGISILHFSALESLYPGKKESLSVVLNRLEKKGIIERIGKGWICIKPCEIWEIVNTVFPTSYISLEWALHYHDIIDQEIKIITLVWLFKPKVVKTRSYVFELHKISRRLYFGFNERRIAEPEKALLDTIYIRRRLPPELNIDLIDFRKLKKYSMRFPKRVRKVVEILKKEF